MLRDAAELKTAIVIKECVLHVNSHALGEPCYIVRPLPPGSDPIANGLPVFTLYYENDDDSERRLGKDSVLHFTAPTEGEYTLLLRDVTRKMNL